MVRRIAVLIGAAGLLSGWVMQPLPSVGAVCNGWSLVPSVPGNVRLLAVEAVSSDDVWAAGQTAEHGMRPFVEHWDGNAWSRVPVPTGDTWQGFNGLAARSSDDVWAVGFSSVKPPDLDP